MADRLGGVGSRGAEALQALGYKGGGNGRGDSSASDAGRSVEGSDEQSAGSSKGLGGGGGSHQRRRQRAAAAKKKMVAETAGQAEGAGGGETAP